MPEELDIQQNKERYADFLNTLPLETKNIILSEDIKILIPAVCLDNGIEDENKIEKIAYQVTMVLLDRISWENFQVWLEKEIRTDAATAKKIAEEMKETIFFEKTEENFLQEELEKKPKPPENDTYKESLE